MTDAIALLTLINTLASQIRTASDLVRRMREEGRETLTAEELAELQSADDAARAAQVAALERAKAEGR